MRILWVSNAPWVGTGYGVQTKIFVPRLRELGHEVAVFAFYGQEGGVIDWGGIPIYPKMGHPYGADAIPQHAQHFKADIVISLIDAWVYKEFIPQWQQAGVRWVPWYPVDHEPIPPQVAASVQQAFARINFSKFGKEMTEQAGLDTYYVPHGVETNVYKPGDRMEARKALGWNTEDYIVGMVAANKGAPSRKAFTECLAAFQVFKERHPEVLLYLHTMPDQRFGGINLPEIVQQFGLEKAVLFANPYEQTIGIPDEQVANVYNAIDVLLSPSMGEGFGVPILEAQACNTPVIVGDWTAMSELCWNGTAIRKDDDDKIYTLQASCQYRARPSAILEALEWEYTKPDRGDIGRKTALGYDADTVTQEYWKPVLESIESRIKRGNRVQEMLTKAVQVPQEAVV